MAEHECSWSATYCVRSAPAALDLKKIEELCGRDPTTATHWLRQETTEKTKQNKTKPNQKKKPYCLQIVEMLLQEDVLIRPK